MTPYDADVESIQLKIESRADEIEKGVDCYRTYVRAIYTLTTATNQPANRNTNTTANIVPLMTHGVCHVNRTRQYCTGGLASGRHSLSTPILITILYSCHLYTYTSGQAHAQTVQHRQFLPRDAAMLARSWNSVRPAVRLSQACFMTRTNDVLQLF